VKDHETTLSSFSLIVKEILISERQNEHHRRVVVRRRQKEVPRVKESQVKESIHDENCNTVFSIFQHLNLFISILFKVNELLQSKNISCQLEGGPNYSMQKTSSPLLIAPPKNRYEKSPRSKTEISPNRKTLKLPEVPW
jgi:hypothetical protein